MPTGVLSYPSGLINHTDPINWSHPLNKGRMFWGLMLPHWKYADRLIDLVAKQDLPKRTATAAIDWRKEYSRPGGFGHLRCTTADTGCRVQVDERCRLAFPFTMAIWFRAFGSPTASAGCFGISDNLLGNSPFLSASLQANSSGNVTYMGNSAGTFYQETTSPTVAWNTLTTWTRVVVTVTASARRFYFNGKYHSQATTTRSSPNFGASANLFFGEPFALTRTINGWLGDGSLSNRAWSDDEVMADYKLGINGYPGVLNRQRRRWAPEQAAAAGGNPWYYYSLLRG